VSVWWAPRRAVWWTGVLFAIGSTCFLVAPFPGYEAAVGSGITGITFFVGSIFFTTAAALQLRTSALAVRGRSRGKDWWASAIQFVGTLFFNITTFRGMQSGLDADAYDKLVWAPDAYGSVCFLVSGFLALQVVRSLRGSLDWWIAAINFAGCVAFGVAAVAGYVVPSTGSELDLAWANGFTSLGGLCFLIGSVLLLPASD
jgi:YrhK-like protein